MTTELGHLVNDLVNAAHKCGAAEDSTNGEEYEVLWSTQVAAEKALLDYLDKSDANLAKLMEGQTPELEQLILNLRNAAYENGTLHPWSKPQTKQFNADTAREASVAAEKALLDYLECGLPPIPKPTEEGFGQLVSELINRTHECALAPDGYGCDAYLAQVAAEKRLLKYVEGIQRANKLLQHDYDDNKRWQKEVLADFKIAYDDSTTGRRMALTQWMADRLAELRALLK